MSWKDRIKREILTRTTKWVNEKKHRDIEGEEFTLISNNCTGGVLLHDFGLRFDTPFINAGVYAEDFWRLLMHFDEYMAMELTKPEQTEYAYPVAMLGDILLRFPHAHDFEEAKTVWDKRKVRIHRENIFVVWVGYGRELPESMLERIAEVPFPKVVFLDHDRADLPYCFHIKGCDHECGEGLSHVWENQGLSGKKYYDQFDFVSWLKRDESMKSYL